MGGEKLNAKGMKEADVALRWSGKSGEITRSDFRREVCALLGSAVVPAEVDSLFGELDADGGGSLDRDELKDALRRVKAEAEAKKHTIRELALQFIQAFKAMRTAQADL